MNETLIRVAYGSKNHEANTEVVGEPINEFMFGVSITVMVLTVFEKIKKDFVEEECENFRNSFYEYFNTREVYGTTDLQKTLSEQMVLDNLPDKTFFFVNDVEIDLYYRDDIEDEMIEIENESKIVRIIFDFYLPQEHP